MSQELFKQALGRFATGVCIVNYWHGDAIDGVTISAFSSLSLAPQKILFCLGNQGKSQQQMQTIETFSVSVLNAKQVALAYQFAGANREGLADSIQTINGQPAIRDALAVLICDKTAAYAEGDHDIIIGDVRHITLSEANQAPLIYYRSTMSEGPIYET